MSGLNRSLSREMCRNVKGMRSIVSDLGENIIGRIMFTISTEGIATQEISKLQQHKYRLDQRKNLLIVRTMRCRECVFKAGYETSITTDVKNRRNFVQDTLKSLETEEYIQLALLLSPLGWDLAVVTLGFILTFSFPFLSPSHRMLLCSCFTPSTFVLLSLYFKTSEVWYRFIIPKKICCLKGIPCWWYHRWKQKTETKPSVSFLSWFLTKPITMLEISHHSFNKGVSFLFTFYQLLYSLLFSRSKVILFFCLLI